MSGALGVASSWFDRVERGTEWCTGSSDRRWSLFQAAWAGLHATAVVMHALSVVYHARRVQEEQRLDTAGVGADTASAWEPRVHEDELGPARLRRSA